MIPSILRKASLIAVLAFSSSIAAHPIWVLPDMFNVSTEEGEWVTFDVSASHTVFGYDKGVQLDDSKVFLPDGDWHYLGSYFQSHRRSIFDYWIDQEGTYRFSAVRPLHYFTLYKSGKRETMKRMWANKIEAQERLPKNAREVKTYYMDMEASAYVTKGAPSTMVLDRRDRGFEFVPVTHPNDVVLGEEAIFKVTLDGDPLADVNIEFTPDGTRYRDDRLMQNYKTDEQGLVSFTPDRFGPWYVSADVEVPSPNALADFVYTVRFITLEVLP